MNKKSNVIYAVILFLIVIVLFGFFSIIGYKMFDDIKPGILEDLSYNESKQVLNDSYTRYPSVFDSVILIVFVGLWIGGIASVFMKEEHPMVFGLMMIAIVFVLIAGMWLANGFEEFTQDSDYSTIILSFPITFFIITHIVELGIGMAVTILLSMYAKNRL